MMMDRRTLLRGAAVAGVLPFLPARVVQAHELSPLAAAARDAWIYGLPLIENAATRQRFAATTTPPNKLIHVRTLTTPKTQTVTTPNNDTLYSGSWLDLSRGPVRITLPATGSRYVSVAFMDMYTNNFAVLGTRTTGDAGGAFTIIGPSGTTDDPLALRSPTPWVWMLIRVFVAGDADLAQANRVQDGFRLDGPIATYSNHRIAKRDAPWDEYFDAVQALVVENPPPATDSGLFSSISPLGLGSRGGFNATKFTRAERTEIEDGVVAAQALLRATRRQGTLVNGWLYPKANHGDFGQDYLYRAQVALGELAALPRAEAMYMRPVGMDGTITLDSSVPWLLRFPAGTLPPVNSFWSLTMYKATPDGQFFFFENPIKRYSISDRTPGLVRDARGGIELYLTRNDPGGSRTANWLPTPPSGQFGVVLRAYLPGPLMLNGAYTLPPIEKAKFIT